MFAQSYDPLSYAQLSPGSNSNKLKQEEMARRQRRLLAEAHQHRRRTKLDRMRRMEEEILLEEEQRRLEARQWAESIGAAPSSSSPPRRDDDKLELHQHDIDASMLGTSFPPPYIIYASVSSDDIMDVSKVHPHLPNIHLSPLRRQPSGHSATTTTIHRQNESWPDIPIPCPTNSCGNRALLHCEEQRQDSEDTTTKNMDIDEEHDDEDDEVATSTPPPPHIIAQHKSEEEDDNDDEDEEDDLYWIWNQVSQDSWELLGT